MNPAEDLPPLVIAGSGRSGTTWLQDAIAEANDLRTIFEPLHPDVIPAARPLASRYFVAGADEPELAAFLEPALRGHMRGWWPNYRVRPDVLRRYAQPVTTAKQWILAARSYRRFRPGRNRRPLVKLIRGNLMLAWIIRHFGARGVLLVRHPGGVVASKLRLDKSVWTDPREILESYLADEQLVADHLTDVHQTLRGSLTPSELHTALWCIENAVPLRQAPDAGIHVTSYERLQAGDAEEWRGVLDALGLQHQPSGEDLTRPSQQVSAEVKGRPFTDRDAHRWLEKLDAEQRRAIDAMLERFGVTQFSTADPLPQGSLRG